MIKINNKQIKELQNGTLKADALVDVLIDGYPVREIAEAFVELLAMKGSPTVDKIAISKETFEQHFRFIGEDGRGRKRKED